MNAVDEVVLHHRFIESWLRGEAEPSAVASFLGRHAPDFTWYDPDGAVKTLPDLAAMMEAAHGASPGLVLEIREPRVLLDETRGGGMVVAAYEEHQRTPVSSDARRAVAVFAPAPGARNGLLWRALHEVWIV
ncbi:DUF4440 domain-containing protein [Actinomadura rugatobispora]|uniref:DUF4440 domain-containing protein n=1 Tax=Actinomadura rugatobispora TaxID=1994 RepID=A0ABW1A072_9ACTN|nr:hypothetical protein GCM10010200_014360 [Actinomadura rugatobispora]